MNSTTTDYPFGFSLYELRGDYALLRSNGTYKDMEKIINKNMSYDTKTEMLTERISELEKEKNLQICKMIKMPMQNVWEDLPPIKT